MLKGLETVCEHSGKKLNRKLVIPMQFKKADCSTKGMMPKAQMYMLRQNKRCTEKSEPTAHWFYSTRFPNSMGCCQAVKNHAKLVKFSHCTKGSTDTYCTALYAPLSIACLPLPISTTFNMHHNSYVWIKRPNAPAVRRIAPAVRNIAPAVSSICPLLYTTHEG